MSDRSEAIKRAKAVVAKKFDLASFKEKKGYTSRGVLMDKQTWLPFSPALQDVLGLPGIPCGHITLFRGHSDTGKTTALLEVARAAQKKGIMPVFIITEMKWSWGHAQEMGFEVEQRVDEETGEVVGYDGFFLFADRETLDTIEDVSVYIADLLDEQAKGNLPYDLCFLWDSIGSVPCELSVKSKKNNNAWNAGAMSSQFGNYLNQKILLSRKTSYPYTNTLVAVNKVWALPPDVPMGTAKMQNKGGMTMWYDASLVITFGGVTHSGTSKINAISKGKRVEFAKKTVVQVEKNHIQGVNTRGRVVMTPHGFILDDKSVIDRYKKDNREYWQNLLDADSFELEEELDLVDDSEDLIYSGIYGGSSVKSWHWGACWWGGRFFAVFRLLCVSVFAFAGYYFVGGSGQ